MQKQYDAPGLTLIAPDVDRSLTEWRNRE